MELEKKRPYVARVELQMGLYEERYWENNEPLIVNTKGIGSSVPIAISRAVRAFKHPNVKRKKSDIY